MINILMLLGLMARQAPVAAAGIQPCVWPNPCAKPAAELVQFQPCVWPHPCELSSQGKA